MTVPVDGSDFSRAEMNRLIEEVRAARPGIRPSFARLIADRRPGPSGKRKMVFIFEDVRVEGLFSNSYEGRIAGWTEWLSRQKVIASATGRE